MTFGFIVLLALILTGIIAFLAVSVSLQEANDPIETRPEDLSEFEKRHVHRTDILPRA